MKAVNALALTNDKEGDEWIFIKLDDIVEIEYFSTYESKRRKVRGRIKGYNSISITLDTSSQYNYSTFELDIEDMRAIEFLD